MKSFFQRTACVAAFGLLLTSVFGCGTGNTEEALEEVQTAETSECEETVVEQLAGTEQTEESEEREPTVTEVVISLAGDCTLGNAQVQGYDGTFNQMYDIKQDPSYFFQNVKDIFSQDDMTLVNFEGVLTDSNERVEKEYNMKGRHEYNQILVEGDIEAVSLGNNHRMDYGEEGLADTLAALDEISMVYAYDDVLGIYETKEGIRIGFVSVNEVYDEELVETFLEEGMKKLREDEVNLVIACCHWGEELEYYPEEYQITLGHKCIDWGADLVVGCHPHVLQGFEYYQGKYIIYSLGNFCFGGNRNPKEKDTMIVQAEFTLEDGVPVGEAELTVIPCTISSVSDRNDFCPTVAGERKRAEIIRELNQYSEQFLVTVDEDGKVIGGNAE